MTAPEQHSPPLYACAAGAVLHAHAGSTLEPAVLLYTFLPPGLGDRLLAPGLRVDVHGNGPGSDTLTLRVLVDGTSLSWQLPIAPVVAALPGQLGDDGRMVLLAVLDEEPDGRSPAEAVDCERLSAELQLPVADLAEALRGRLTRWLADDLEGLLHDDAHDRAVDRSPAQTLASAVLAHYRDDVAASQETTRLVRALELAPEEYMVELGARLCAALVTAVELSSTADRAAVAAATGPFETEALRLLNGLPDALDGTAPEARTETAMTFLLEGEDRDEVVRAAVALVARLARQSLGSTLPDQELLPRLGMTDDAGLVRLAGLWVELATAAVGTSADLPALLAHVRAEGVPGLAWLRGTAGTLAEAATEVAGRSAGRLAQPLEAARRLVAAPDQAGVAELEACLALARFLRSRAGAGPGAWLQVPAGAAVRAVVLAELAGLDRELVVDLLGELLEDDVDGPDLLDGFVCVTSRLLAEVDPVLDGTLRRTQLAEAMSALPAGPRGARWLLGALVREAPGHDPAAVDLAAFLPGEAGVDVERAAARAGRVGVLRAGLACLDVLAATFSEEAGLPRDELLGVELPSALFEHELLL